jgi:hypothetical protein
MGCFGPGKYEAWEDLCHELGGEFVPGTLFKGAKVKLVRGPWTTVLDTVSQGEDGVYTRMRTPFHNPVGFRFQIYRKTLLSGLGKMLGMQDLEIGDPEFDEAFIIKSNDEDSVRELFGSPKVRRLIQAQPRIRLEIKDNEGFFGTRFPDDVDELHFLATGVIKDRALLKALFELFAAVLDRLCFIHTATKEHPGVSL